MENHFRSRIVDFKDYFTATRNERNVALSLDENLPDNVLQANSVIVLTLVATVEGSSDLTGYTVVIISLPDSEGLPATGKNRNIECPLQPSNLDFYLITPIRCTKLYEAILRR